MSGGLLLAWSTVPGKVLSPVLIANLLVFSGLAQVLVFAVMVWFEPFHLGGASALAGLLIVLAMEIAQFQPVPDRVSVPGVGNHGAGCVPRRAVGAERLPPLARGGY